MESVDHRTPRKPEEPSVFTAANLLRESQKQRGLPAGAVPELCLLDPDGDFVRDLRRTGQAKASPHWACYHTELWLYDVGGKQVGVVGMAVGAPFAVLVAEELFASGCRLLLSLTSAGQLRPLAPPPYFVFIDRALRDEGTSGHYLPAAHWSRPMPSLEPLVAELVSTLNFKMLRGSAWTTDAPFRETATAIAAAKEVGAELVEMEAAALYAFSEATGNTVLCFAQVTNQMAQQAGDFAKGEANSVGQIQSLIVRVLRIWEQREASDLRPIAERSPGVRISN
jgi:uridine phosphorylase